jgi:glycosyltransferase involved in cell wall biosynthesis
MKMQTWQIITGEYPPVIGGVSGYSQLVAEGLAGAGDEVHVWCPPLPQVAVCNGVTVHPVLGHISRRDLCAVDLLLDRFPPPRRLLVQWVPHGFGYRSMNVGFCLWLWQRARRGDRVEIMVHEPYLAFGEGALRWTAAAFVHRVMTVILARAARRVWIAIPAWERRWRPYALGRDVSFAWLPIPSSLPLPAPDDVRRVRDRYGLQGGPIVGHLGSYGTAATRVLSASLPEILQRSSSSVALLLGQNGDTLYRRLAGDHPQLAPRLHAIGALSSDVLAQHVGACDLLIQPYPDGITSRRTSAMAGLALGVPVVTTRGHLTEPLWAETGCVALVSVDEPHVLGDEALRLLSNDRKRRDLAARGRDIYARRFDLQHTIGALRRAAEEPCASPS